METTSSAVARAPAAEDGEPVPSARRTVDGYLRAPFPWYGLDEAFTGRRWLMQVGLAAAGAVEHGSVGHGDEPSVRSEYTAGSDQEAKEKFAVVVTVAANPVRRCADGSTLSLPVDGVPTPFHYRESEFGWVLAGSTAAGVHVGAYGRGMSAYGLGFAVVKDIAAYQD